MGFVPNVSVLRLNRAAGSRSPAWRWRTWSPARSAPSPCPTASARRHPGLPGRRRPRSTRRRRVTSTPTPRATAAGRAASGRTTRWRPSSASVYGSFEPDNGVLIAKNKALGVGRDCAAPRSSSCGYNCFTWVEDAHPEDMNTGRLLQAGRHAGHAHRGRLPAAQRRAVPRRHQLGLVVRSTSTRPTT